VLTAVSTADATPLWRYRLDAAPASAPLESQGTVLLTDRSGTLHALDAASGAPRWQYTAGQRITTAPLACQDRLFIAAWKPDRLVCLHAATGKPLWQKKGSGAFAAQPFIVDGNVYAADRAGVLQGWDPRTKRSVFRTDGILWDPETQGEPVVHHGVLYVTTRRGTVRALRLP
jgi:outer membrane protein assembly factor BamB